VKPTELLARAPTGDGDEMTLTRRDGAYYLNLRSSGELMTSRAHGSEKALATLAIAAMPKVPKPRVLIGGLGFGYTLRAALDALPAQAEVVVAELFDLVLDANRGEVGELAGRPLDDPRVAVRMGDVRDALGAATFEAILLDVDNGPEAFTLAGNSRLYTAKGLGKLAHSLVPRGILGIWSNAEGPPSEAVLKRFESSGFYKPWVERTRSRDNKRGSHHTIVLARRL
jgi:spermidine synthase